LTGDSCSDVDTTPQSIAAEIGDLYIKCLDRESGAVAVRAIISIIRRIQNKRVEGTLLEPSGCRGETDTKTFDQALAEKNISNDDGFNFNVSKCLNLSKSMHDGSLGLDVIVSRPSENWDIVRDVSSAADIVAPRQHPVEGPEGRLIEDERAQDAYGNGIVESGLISDDETADDFPVAPDEPDQRRWNSVDIAPIMVRLENESSNIENAGQWLNRL
jgi:hypothetical protein